MWTGSHSLTGGSWAATTLKPLKAQMNNIVHLIVVLYPAGKPVERQSEKKNSSPYLLMTLAIPQKQPEEPGASWEVHEKL